MTDLSIVELRYTSEPLPRAVKLLLIKKFKQILFLKYNTVTATR